MVHFPLPAVLPRLALTLGIATLGGALFHLAGLPAAWLSGGMVLVAAATLAGAPTEHPDRVRAVLFVVLGISMGAGVRPDVVERIGEWPLSMAIMSAVIIGVTLAGYCVLHFGARWQRETAFFGAIPGTLAYVIALATERGADVPRIASTQSVRLFFLVAVLPYAVVSSNGVDAVLVVDRPVSGLRDILIGVPLCIAASLTAVRIGMPGAWLTGAFLMSAALNASGFVILAIPEALLVPCFVTMGAMIGCRFREMTLRQFIGVLGASVAAFVAAFSVSVLGALTVAHVMHIPFGQALLAFAPGGLEVMTLLAFILDLDPAFVAAHQIVRFTGMVFLLPLLTAILLGRPEADGPAERGH